MLNRFFSETPISGDRATISGSEAHHLLHVMRLDVGDDVVLFDGTGSEFAARVAECSRTEVTLSVLSQDEVDRELSIAITLAVALPKGERQRWLVEKAVELGVARLVPVSTQRSVAQPEGKTCERLRRAVIEASKQSGRNRLMEITEPVHWPEFLSSSSDTAVRIMAQPGSSRDDPQEDPISTAHRARSVCLAVGPEGGFTDEEVRAAKDLDWKCVDLGSRILRVETAAVFLVSLVSGSNR